MGGGGGGQTNGTDADTETQALVCGTFLSLCKLELGYLFTQIADDDSRDKVIKYLEKF